MAMTKGKNANAEIEVLLKYCEEVWNQVRHLENQRATFTNFMLVVSVGIIGFVMQNGLSTASLPLTIALVVLGFYGAIASYKFYERHQFHRSHSELWLAEINRQVAEAKFKKFAQLAFEKHNRQFPVMSKVHVHTLWITFNLLIVLAGILLTMLSLGIIK